MIILKLQKMAEQVYFRL